MAHGTPTHLKQDGTGRVYVYTADLAKRPDMKPHWPNGKPKMKELSNIPIIPVDYADLEPPNLQKDGPAERIARILKVIPLLDPDRDFGESKPFGKDRGPRVKKPLMCALHKRIPLKPPLSSLERDVAWEQHIAIQELYRKEEPGAEDGPKPEPEVVIVDGIAPDEIEETEASEG